MRVAQRTAEAAAQQLGIARKQVLVASTGVIGVPLDEERIPRALPWAVEALSPGRFAEAAAAIMTTDTRPKIACRAAGGRGARVLGMAKGAGMIHPRMATMLAFVLTDAAVSVARLRRMTKAAANSTFNRISVDGDTSTNDTLFVLANGAAGPVADKRLLAALEEVMGELALAIASDGEGARKVIQIEVTGARNEGEADLIARAIANSPLVKTAIAGGDPNWGRILSAAGASGAPIDPGKVSILLNGTKVCRRGMAADFDEGALNQTLSKAREVEVRVDVGRGRGRVRFWTCDLTEEYVRINASYRT
jgi:glutamate N-acetyltransferase/amino-acid N-acetyltransferase